MFWNKEKPKPTWKELLKQDSPVQLPAAHDALTAKLIERAGFSAYQIGGFPLAGARHGLPDIDLTRFAEQAAGVRDILAACSLPVLVDGDDGYGDVKNVTSTVRSYEAMGVSAIFLEDRKFQNLIASGPSSQRTISSGPAFHWRFISPVATKPVGCILFVARTPKKKILA